MVGNKNGVPEMLTVKETAARLSIPYNAVRRMCLNDNVVYIRNGRNYLINWKSVIDYFSSGKPQGSDDNGRIMKVI